MDIQKAAWEMAGKRRHQNTKIVSPGVLQELRGRLGQFIVESDVDDFLCLLWYLGDIMELTQGQATATLELSRAPDFKEAMRIFLDKVQGVTSKMRVRRALDSKEAPRLARRARPTAAPRKAAPVGPKLAQLRAEKSELKKSIAALKRRQQELEAQVKNLAAQEKRLQEIKTEQEEATRQRARARKRCDKLTRQIEELEQESQSLETSVRNQRRLKKTLAADIERLQERHDTAQRKLVNLQFNLEAWEAEKQRRADLAADLELKILELEEQVHDLKALRQERAAVLAETENLRRETQEWQRKLEQLQTRLASRDELVAGIAALERQKEQSYDDLLAMSKRLAKQQRAHAKAVREREVEERKLKVVQREHARLQEGTRLMAAQLAEYQQHQAEAAELEARVERARQAITDTEARLADLTTALEQAARQKSLPLWLALLRADLRAGGIAPIIYRENGKTYTLWGDELLARLAALVPDEIAPAEYAALAWSYAARGAETPNVPALRNLFPVDDLLSEARLAAGVVLAREYEAQGDKKRAAEELLAGWEAWLES